MTKKVALVFGAIFLLISVLGFVPGTTTEIDGVPHIFGVIMTGILQGALYMASGIIALLAASSERYSRWYLQIFGIIYAVISFLGFMQSDTILGAIGVSFGSNVLHAVLGVLMLCAGFLLPVGADRAMTLTKPTRDKPAM